MIPAQLQLDDARLLLRLAAIDLSPLERKAAEGLAHGVPTRHMATGATGEGRASVFNAQQRALRKMRRTLIALGVRSAWDVL